MKFGRHILKVQRSAWTKCYPHRAPKNDGADWAWAWGYYTLSHHLILWYHW